MATGEYKLRVSVDGVNQAQGQLKNLGGTVNNIGKSVGRMVGAFVSIYAATKAIKYVIDNVKEEEAAVISLNAALSNTGIYSDNFSKALRDNASALQSMTIYADEAIIAGTALVQNIGNLSAEQLPAAQKAAIGLAAAFNMDLQTAFQMVGKAAAGNTATLSRYGIVLDEGLSAEEKFNKVLEMGASKFSLAEAAATSFGGRIAQMKNAMSDMAENIGYAVLPALTEIAKSVSTMFQDIGPVLEPLLKSLSSGFAKLVPTVMPLLQSLVGMLGAILPGAIDLLTTAFAGMMPAITTIMNALMTLIPPIMAILDAFAPILPMLADFVALAVQAVAPVLVQLLNAIIPIIDVVIALAMNFFSQLYPSIIAIIKAISPLITLVGSLLTIFAPLLEIAGKVANFFVGQFANAILAVAKSIEVLLYPLVLLNSLLGKIMPQTVALPTVTGISGLVKTTITPSIATGVTDGINDGLKGYKPPASVNSNFESAGAKAGQAFADGFKRTSDMLREYRESLWRGGGPTAQDSWELYLRSFDVGIEELFGFLDDYRMFSAYLADEIAKTNDSFVKETRGLQLLVIENAKHQAIKTAELSYQVALAEIRAMRLGTPEAGAESDTTKRLAEMMAYKNKLQRIYEDLSDAAINDGDVFAAAYAAKLQPIIDAIGEFSFTLDEETGKILIDTASGVFGQIVAEGDQALADIAAEATDTTLGLVMELGASWQEYHDLRAQQIDNEIAQLGLQIKDENLLNLIYQQRIGLIDKEYEAYQKLRDEAAMDAWIEQHELQYDLISNTVDIVTEGFATMIREGKSFGETMKDIWKDWVAMAIQEVQRLVAKLITAFIIKKLIQAAEIATAGIGTAASAGAGAIVPELTDAAWLGANGLLGANAGGGIGITTTGGQGATLNQVVLELQQLRRDVYQAQPNSVKMDFKRGELSYAVDKDKRYRVAMA